MATIKIIADSNADAVWIWELLKKLGYEVEVVFDCSDSIQLNHRRELLQKNEARQLLNELIRSSQKESRFVGYNESITKQGNRYKPKKRSKFRR